MTAYQFYDCRDRGHAWFLPEELRKLQAEGAQLPAAVIAKLDQTRFSQGFALGPHEAERDMLCIRCATGRNELFTRGGISITTPHYGYVDGYLIPGGVRGRSEYRKVAVKAALRAIRGKR